MRSMSSHGEPEPARARPDAASTPEPGPSFARATEPSRARFLFWLCLAVSWVILLPFLWSAVTTLPSPERLDQSRTVAIPTLGSFLRVMAVSAAELVAALLIIWPAWRSAYTLRLFGAAALLGMWFVFSAPMSLTRLEWVHRRWLALLAFLQFAAGVYRLVRGWTAKRRARRQTTS
ncbi:MAG TPA: hypothetical protein VFU06_03460 [Longimicrobiales bacterium]|nr:hypothetical protein [Longimicrobiales bacterium]